VGDAHPTNSILLLMGLKIFEGGDRFVKFSFFLILDITDILVGGRCPPYEFNFAFDGIENF
jgi:hypothetical protein